MIDKFKDKYSFLSNFYATMLRVGNRNWPSSEHYFQAMKTTDLQLQESIRTSETKRAKQLGRKIPIRKDWEEIKEKVMLRILRIKFSKPHLKNRLIDTGEEELIEGNWWHDNYWGDCYCDKCKSKKGLNRLGILLMQVRKEKRHENFR